MHCTDVESLCGSCMALYRDRCVYRKVWSPSVAGGWVGLPLGLLLLHGAATGPATGNFYLLSSVKILATSQSLSTQHPHHRRSRQDQCVGRRGGIVRNVTGVMLALWPLLSSIVGLTSSSMSGHVDTAHHPSLAGSCCCTTKC